MVKITIIMLKCQNNYENEENFIKNKSTKTILKITLLM